MKLNVKYGCENCGRYVEYELNSMSAFGSFNDSDIADTVKKICNCKKVSK
ncbi:MAG TPA: hypothetical protein VMZ91_14665 [Candidatus Paceibacterota bacterium]|nr:hypothetical protein [Candidatus Paceibacterota bacterium]